MAWKLKSLSRGIIACLLGALQLKIEVVIIESEENQQYHPILYIFNAIYWRIYASLVGVILIQLLHFCHTTSLIIIARVDIKIDDMLFMLNYIWK